MKKAFFYYLLFNLCSYTLSSIEGKDFMGRRNRALREIRRLFLLPEGKDQAHVRENSQPYRGKLLEVIKESYKTHTF
jgi:hypothetical protein